MVAPGIMVGGVEVEVVVVMRIEAWARRAKELKRRGNQELDTSKLQVLVINSELGRDLVSSQKQNTSLVSSRVN